jgi:hypothetical protein
LTETPSMRMSQNRLDVVNDLDGVALDALLVV